MAGIPCIGIACWNDTNWSSLNFPNPTHFAGIGAICEYNGSIYVGGGFAEDSIDFISRWDGKNWRSVGGGLKGNSEIYCMAVYQGELYVAGTFFQSDGNADNNIQKWNGTSWSAVGGGTDYEIFNLMVYKNKLYAMGQFTEAGGVPATSIAEWDGSQWCSMGGIFDNAIGASCIYKDSLYVGGGFWTINGDSTLYLAEWVGGNYTDGCGSTAGVSEVKNNSEAVSIYPNPNNGQFSLTLSNENEKCNVEIYNVFGENIYQAKINSDNTEINLSGQPNGVYLYRVITETGELIGEGKVIIQK